jgi:dUTP pyrophosphatase
MSEAMKIHKLYANTLELKLGSHEAACYDIHAHLRGPVTPEDVAPLIREIKWYDGYNQPHTSMPDVVFDSDVPICTFTLNPKCRALIPTGMVMDIPLGFSARLHPRSGLAVKNGVTLINAEGVIDSDYCHEVFVPLHNTTNTPFKITHGDRIAQVEIIEYARHVRYVTYTQATPESQKTNRVGGFGSTGV